MLSNRIVIISHAQNKFIISPLSTFINNKFFRHNRRFFHLFDFSIRIKQETVNRIDALAQKTDRSRNELIGMLLDFALEHCETE